MKQIYRNLLLCFGLGLVTLAGTRAAQAQLPIINSLNYNGQLTCSNLPPNAVAVVEWAPSLSGPWTNALAWTGVAGADSNGTISLSVPMFFRVRGAPSPTNGMVLIPGGSFTMGNVSGDLDITDAVPVSVYVSGFYVDLHPVTYGRWQTIYTIVTNSLGYRFQGSGWGTNPGTNYPITTVNFQDCVKWCNARSQVEGLTPVYYTDADFTQVYTNLFSNGFWYVNWAANGYRLPTEAEWEKAARGGVSGLRFPWGDTISESQANYLGDTVDYSYDLGPSGYNPLAGPAGGTLPVGMLALNGYGLSDMAGNVQEWVWDTYGTPYAGGTDPHGPSFVISQRITRGGSWYDSAAYARCASRFWVGPAGSAHRGFRCVRNQ